MDHQQYKLVVTVNFSTYPIDHGKMLPTSKLEEKHIGVMDGSIRECKEFIADFISKHNDLVKMG